jgi:hypothetical protein
MSCQTETEPAQENRGNNQDRGASKVKNKKAQVVEKDIAAESVRDPVTIK